MGATWTLPLNSGHPAAHGGLRLEVELDGATVTSATCLPGRMHRGAEKLFESRDYRSVLALANRHDWLSAFGSELGLAQLLERMLGIEVPERARVLRVLVAELSRVAHHLLWLAATAKELGEDAAAAVGFAARETVLGALESYSGARMHLMVIRVGGLRADASPEWLARLPAVLSEIDSAVTALTDAFEALADRTRGVAVLATAQAADFAASGPVARASGQPLDLRFDRIAGVDDADEVYQRLIDGGVLRRATASAGDAKARFEILLAQARSSRAAVAATADWLAELAPGPVDVPLPKVLRVPEGHGYGATENPTGINGWYLVSRGGPVPYRLKLRTASFNNAQSLSVALPGTAVDDLPVALFSYLLVAGDIDK